MKGEAARVGGGTQLGGRVGDCDLPISSRGDCDLPISTLGDCGFGGCGGCGGGGCCGGVGVGGVGGGVGVGGGGGVGVGGGGGGGGGGDGGEQLVRRVVPADNSCLFVAVALALEGGEKGGEKGGEEGGERGRAAALREVVARAVLADPERFSEAVLGRLPPSTLPFPPYP